MKKRIICWVGNAPNHRALVSKLAEQFEIAGVVIDNKKTSTGKKGIAYLLQKFYHKWRFGKIDAAWSSLQAHYRTKYPEWPATSLLFTDSVNSEEAYAFTQKLAPDLVVVSGTSLVREPMVSLPVPIGIMNLHTGLSPYIKGGPNCTNWCIANNEWALIGNTIMWLSAGIDSGNIICSEQTDLKDEKELDAIHRRVMEHAHDLYLRAIAYVLHHEAPYPSVPQSSLGKGKLFLTRMWTAEKKAQLLSNLGAERNNSFPAAYRTIPLPQ